jgi:hypothetical protein
MNDLVETFEIYSGHDNKFVCKMDPMLFLLVIMVFMILLYIIHFKIN